MLRVADCVFEAVDVGSSAPIIDDASLSAEVEIESTVFSEFVAASIYLDDHFSASYLSVKEVVLSTSLLLGDWALFEFVVVDHVVIDGLSAKYSYDITANCAYNKGIESNDDPAIPNEGELSLCSDPISLVSNYGVLSLSEITLFFDAQNASNSSSSSSSSSAAVIECFEYEWSGDSGLISNFGVLSIDRMTSNEPMAAIFLFNQGTAAIDALHFDEVQDAEFNVNALRSRNVIYQRG